MWDIWYTSFFVTVGSGKNYFLFPFQFFGIGDGVLLFYIDDHEQ